MIREAKRLGENPGPYTREQVAGERSTGHLQHSRPEKGYAALQHLDTPSPLVQSFFSPTARLLVDQALVWSTRHTELDRPALIVSGA